MHGYLLEMILNKPQNYSAVGHKIFNSSLLPTFTSILSSTCIFRSQLTGLHIIKIYYAQFLPHHNEKMGYRTFITFYYSLKHLVQRLNIILSSTDFNKAYDRVYFYIHVVFADIHSYCHRQNYITQYSILSLVLTNKRVFLIFHNINEYENINNNKVNSAIFLSIKHTHINK